VNGFRFDYASLLACAWGKPSDAFGPMYSVFDDTRRVARLPGPPYHFMSRVTRVDGPMGLCEPGASVEIAYDVPDDAWYFDENGHRVMPFAVLLEAVLQPCGWLASYVGSALLGTEDLMFRNLDGTGTVHAEVPPGTRTLRTLSALKSVSRSGGMILQTFDVRCYAGEALVYTLETVFGFFPKAALENQVGLPTSAAERALFEAPTTASIDLTSSPARYCEGSLRLAAPMLRMLDRITAFDPKGGRAGLGFLRAEKDVDPGEWFFKAHFFQDPVQPGSLGLEAMLQLLQFYMLERGLGEGLASPRFEPIALERPMTWKYRGQVVPKDKRITTTLEVTEVGRDEGGPFAVADASLWIDGKRIYQANGLAMRILSAAPGATTLPGEAPSRPASSARSVDADEASRLPEPPLAPTTAASALRAAPTPLRSTRTPAVRDFWRGFFGQSAPPVEDFYRGLVDRFLREVHIEDPEGLAAARDRGVLFLGNHQTSVESTVFAIVGSALMESPVLTLARIENDQHWLYRLMQLSFDYPGLRGPKMTQHFDRRDRASLPGIIASMAQLMRDTGRSVMVHVEGTRSLSCRAPVEKVSGTFIDMALEVNRPIVPVRFVGGLPATPVSERLELPVGMGKQDIHLGALLTPDALRPLSYRERRERVLAAINGLGPSNAIEEPIDPDPVFEAAVKARMEKTGVELGHAAVACILEALPDPCPAIAALLRGDDTAEARDADEARWLAELSGRLLGPAPR
jgi:3-hydroxymyristoyl/3-hydroxydecanoyl-(acyl carrier protein) dehydratase